MSSRRESSIDIWKLVLRLSKNCKSYRDIAKIIGRNHMCVQKIICKYKREGLVENKCGRGRKEVLSSVAKRKIIKEFKSYPKVIAVKLAVETSAIIGRNICAETVRNVIRKSSFNGRVARKKPIIILQNQRKRLQFAKTYQLKTKLLEKGHIQ